MRLTTYFAVFIVAIFAAAAAPSANAAQADDACLLVTQAQVTAALGISMAAGTHVTPTFLKTCTWTPSGGATKDVSAITVSLQAADAYEAGKKMLEQMTAMMMVKKDKDAPPTVITPVSGVGDDAYYLDMANTMSLIVKKGSAAFKIVIYGHMPTEKRQSAEKTLALQVLSKL